MTHRTLGRTGLRVAPLGFGSAPVGYLGTDRQQAVAMLNQLLDRGINLIDTAASYPGSEELIGEALSGRRAETILVSKCGQTFPDLPGKAWSPELIAATVDRSLKRLRTDVLDVMLLHSCDLKTLQAGGAVGALARARDAGKIRFAGYSGDNEAAAHAVTLPDVAVVETSVNVVDQINIDKVLPAAVRHDVGVLAKRPIANACWKDLSAQPGMYQNYAKTYTERLAKMNLKPQDVGFPAGAWPELALRFTLAQPGVHCAIIGTTNPQNAETNIAFASKEAMPADAVAKVRAAFRAADPDGAWTGQT